MRAMVLILATLAWASTAEENLPEKRELTTSLENSALSWQNSNGEWISNKDVEQLNKNNYISTTQINIPWQYTNQNNEWDTKQQQKALNDWTPPALQPPERKNNKELEGLNEKRLESADVISNIWDIANQKPNKRIWKVQINHVIEDDGTNEWNNDYAAWEAHNEQANNYRNAWESQVDPISMKHQNGQVNLLSTEWENKRIGKKSAINNGLENHSHGWEGQQQDRNSKIDMRNIQEWEVPPQQSSNSGSVWDSQWGQKLQQNQENKPSRGNHIKANNSVNSWESQSNEWSSQQQKENQENDELESQIKIWEPRKQQENNKKSNAWDSLTKRWELQLQQSQENQANGKTVPQQQPNIEINSGLVNQNNGWESQYYEGQQKEIKFGLGTNIQGLEFKQKKATRKKENYSGATQSRLLGPDNDIWQSDKKKGWENPQAKQFTINKEVKHPVFRPYPVPVLRKIPILIPQPVPVPFDRPIPIRIERPYPVPVYKSVPITIIKKVPYPVHIPVDMSHSFLVSIPVQQSYSSFQV